MLLKNKINLIDILMDTKFKPISISWWSYILINFISDSYLIQILHLFIFQLIYFNTDDDEEKNLFTHQ